MTSDRVPVPAYRGTVIYTCPGCGGDLEHDGADFYWCRACQQSWHFSRAVLYEDEDPHDD